MSMLAPKLAETAEREIGTTEDPPFSNCGPRVNEYKAATDLPPLKAWPWCAAFVCWCVREAMRAAGIKQTATFKRPITAGAWDYERWSQAQDASTITKIKPGNDIQRGDIITFKFSHIGIATSSPKKDGTFTTCEGNTDSAGSREGGGVMRKTRRVSDVRARIRFTV